MFSSKRILQVVLTITSLTVSVFSSTYEHNECHDLVYCHLILGDIVNATQGSTEVDDATSHHKLAEMFAYTYLDDLFQQMVVGISFSLASFEPVIQSVVTITILSIYSQINAFLVSESISDTNPYGSKTANFTKVPQLTFRFVISCHLLLLNNKFFALKTDPRRTPLNWCRLLTR